MKYLAAILLITSACSHPRPQIVEFRAAPAEVEIGNSVTIHWATLNASRVRLEPGAMELPAVGSKVLHPNSCTTYSLYALGPAGNAVAMIDVKVYAQ